MYLNDFILFLFFKVCNSYVVIVEQIPWFLSFHINCIKFIWTTRRNSRLDLVSWKYPVRFSTYIIFSSLVSFAFCLLVFFLFFIVFFTLEICILIHMRLCGRVSDKEILNRPILAWGESVGYNWLNPSASYTKIPSQGKFNSTTVFFLIIIISTYFCECWGFLPALSQNVSFYYKLCRNSCVSFFNLVFFDLINEGFRMWS